jgi:hypothetical protein
MEYFGISKIYDYSMNLLSFKEFDIVQMNITINALNVQNIKKCGELYQILILF